MKVLALDETVRKPRAASVTHTHNTVAVARDMSETRVPQVLKQDDIARLRECSPSAEEVEMLSPFGEDPRLKETVRGLVDCHCSYCIVLYCIVHRVSRGRCGAQPRCAA